jgi:hypothetical protein
MNENSYRSALSSDRIVDAERRSVVVGGGVEVAIIALDAEGEVGAGERKTGPTTYP